MKRKKNFAKYVDNISTPKKYIYEIPSHVALIFIEFNGEEGDFHYRLISE